jgi:hypothetical protein
MPLPNCVPARSQIFAEAAARLLSADNSWVLAELERKRRIWAVRKAGIAAKLEADKKRKEASEEAKRFILAKIERERLIRAARGDTRPTWISCPDVPEMERLAA